MNKLIFNYHTDTRENRLEIYRDLPYAKEILYSMLYLHSAHIISLDNILNIKERVYA